MQLIPDREIEFTASNSNQTHCKNLLKTNNMDIEDNELKAYLKLLKLFRFGSPISG